MESVGDIASTGEASDRSRSQQTMKKGSVMEPDRRSAPASAERRLVGREGDLRRLRPALSAALAGATPAVLVEGPAGVGKTALLERLLDDAPALAVLRAGGEEAERAIPLGVAHQLLYH